MTGTISTGRLIIMLAGSLAVSASVFFAGWQGVQSWLETDLPRLELSRKLKAGVLAFHPLISDTLPPARPGLPVTPGLLADGYVSGLKKHGATFRSIGTRTVNTHDPAFQAVRLEVTYDISYPVWLNWTRLPDQLIRKPTRVQLTSAGGNTIRVNETVFLVAWSAQDREKELIK